MFFVAVTIFMKVTVIGNLNKSYKISNEQREYVSKETVVLRRLESITGQLISIIN